MDSKQTNTAQSRTWHRLTLCRVLPGTILSLQEAPLLALNENSKKRVKYCNVAQHFLLAF